LNGKRAQSAGTRPEDLAAVYERQFRELTHLRRHILSLLPLRSWDHLVEPGCGTGLLAACLSSLTPASYTGIDLDAGALSRAAELNAGTDGFRFVCADARNHVPQADAYVSSFFLAMLPNPVEWLQKVFRALPPGGTYAVFGEYDYESLREDPGTGLAQAIRDSLEGDGFSTGIGGELDELFVHAGYTVEASGAVRGPLQEPDRTFLEFQLGPDHPAMESGTRLSWTVTWGIYRRR
jgi:SAM-dependent methyltransferase